MNKVVIDPLTRVEGHGRVELFLNEGRLEDVSVRMLESPRLFEKIVVGHKYDEVADLVCRICAICSAVHKLTALEALERALDVEVPPLAAAIRELLLLGGHIQSHALHLFCLVLPDFEAEDHVVALLKRNHPLASAGLKLKAFGNQLQEVVGGRVIHPVNPVVGGVLYRPQDKLLRDLVAQLEIWLKQWPGYEYEFNSSAHFPAAKAVHATPLAIGAADHFALRGTVLRVGHDREVPASEYRQVLREQSDAASYAKLSTGDAAPYYVGALARAQLSAGKVNVSENTSQENIYANNTAQAQEIGWALERAHELAEKILVADAGSPLHAKTVRSRGGEGVAVMEAPRGLLVHEYIVDEWGDVVAADVVTPTAINQLAMQQQILDDLSDIDDVSLMKSMAERIVRAFDPCISCAVHLLEM